MLAQASSLARVENVTNQAEPERRAELLAAKSQAGCRESFGALVELYHGRIFNFLLRLTGNRQDAEDLAQETFVRAFRSLPRYQPGWSFTTWLFTICRRTAASYFRSRTEVGEHHVDTARLMERTDPAGLLVQQDETASLWSLARRLRPKQYQALWLRYGEDLSVAEVARVMGTNQIHVKVLLHRARTRLATALQRKPNASVPPRPIPTHP